MEGAAHTGKSRHRLSAALPDLSAEEYATLVESVRQDGLRDAIWMLDGEVLDGWHRYCACREAQVQPRYREYEGESPATFVIEAQRGRRNWSSSQAAAAAARLKADLEAEARQRMEAGRDASGSAGGRGKRRERERENPRQRIDEGIAVPTEAEVNGRDYWRENGSRSAARAAAALGTNRQYISDYERIEREAPELAEKVRSGRVGIPGAKRRLNARDVSERRRAEAAAENAAPTHEAQLHCADFREVSLPEARVDAIITDPPYSLEHLPLYSDLAEYASRVLREGGVLVAMSAHIYLPEVLRRLGEHLEYVWLLSCEMPGGVATVWPRSARVGWKPVLLYSKRGYRGGLYYDRIISRTDVEYSKDYHAWSQAEDVFSQLVSRFTGAGDLVLDPFMGSGTTGAAALAAKRRFIGVENDPAAFETARIRLSSSAAEAAAE